MVDIVSASTRDFLLDTEDWTGPNKWFWSMLWAEVLGGSSRKKYLIIGMRPSRDLHVLFWSYKYIIK